MMMLGSGIRGNRVTGKTDDGFIAEPVDFQTGLPAASGDVIGTENVGTALLRLGGVDHEAFLPGVQTLDAITRQARYVRAAGLPVLLFLAGCPEEQVCVQEPALTYETFGKGFMDQYCAGCHSSLYPEGHPNRTDAPGSVNFDSYGGVLEHAERVYIAAYDFRTMPPAGGPNEEELERLQEWLRCEVFPDAEVEEWW